MSERFLSLLLVVLIASILLWAALKFKLGHAIRDEKKNLVVQGTMRALEDYFRSDDKGF